MSSIDPHTPVIVGVGQLNRHEEDDRDAVDLMVDVVRTAIADADAASIPDRIDLIAVVDGLWSWTDPARLVTDRLGAAAARTMLTSFGGQIPQTLTAALAARIGTGELDLAVVCGGEVNRTRRRARREGRELRRVAQEPGVEPTERFGSGLHLGTELEQARGLVDPATAYAVIESVLMAANQEGPDAHRRQMGELWARFAAVAAQNAHAADRSRPDAGQITTVTPRNRMVVWPYTKALCANNDVDMAAALILCSAEAATDLGIDRDLWVFPWAGTRADDTHQLGARERLDRSPALAEAGRAVLDHCRLGVEDLDHLELYGCFPSIVEMTTDALEIDRRRPLTMTGGLGFAGAAMNTSTLHGLCAMTDGLRRQPGTGLVQGNGGYATNHAFGVYSSQPPERPFVDIDRQSEVSLAARRVAAADAAGPVEIEGYAVRFDRAGPTGAVVACLTTDGARAWGSSTSPDVMATLMLGAVGLTGRLAADGEVTL
jgi:acetyl-CoA C-acetyltransferase